MDTRCNPVTRMNDELQLWIRQQLDAAVLGFIKTELFEDALIEVKPAWTLPLKILIGKVREQSNPTTFRWFICGEVPLDHVGAEVAISPRDVIRHFAMKWQLDSEALQSGDATTLIEHAQSLYPLADDDRLWG